MKSISLRIFLLSILSALPAYADHPTLSLEDGSPGPVTTISAMPLPKGALSSAFVSQFIFNNAISDAELLGYADLDDAVHSTDSVISSAVTSAYGVTDDFTLGFSLPYIWRTNLREGGISHGNSGHVEHGGERTAKHGDEDHGDDDDEEEEGTAVVERLGDSTGLGDATLYGQFRFFHDKSRDFNAAVLAGMKMPTGRTDVHTAEGGLFEAEHQPGSGSWDPLLGLALTRHVGRCSFDVNGLYVFVNEGSQQTNLGDIINYNAAVSYRVAGYEEAEREPVHHHPTTWDLILEANGDWRDQVESRGAEVENTGGNLIFLSGGTRLAWGHGWACTLSVGAPVVENLNGIQSEPNLRMLVGLSKAF